MLSQRGRYALKAMICLARQDAAAAAAQVNAIAAGENIPRKFLEAIMSDLRQAELVESKRGKAGGYRLARSADQITFAEIIRVIDGPLALVACASVNAYQRCADCPDERACALRRVMVAVRAEVSGILERMTLHAAIASSGADHWIITQNAVVVS